MEFELLRIEYSLYSQATRPKTLAGKISMPPASSVHDEKTADNINSSNWHRFHRHLRLCIATNDNLISCSATK